MQKNRYPKLPNYFIKSLKRLPLLYQLILLILISILFVIVNNTKADESVEITNSGVLGADALELRDEMIVDGEFLQKYELYKVLDVVDGDTIGIDVNGKREKVRLIGIDAPETTKPGQPPECFGHEAAEELKDLVEGAEIYLVTDYSQGEYDRYGRFLGYLFLEDGTNVGYELIANGFVNEYTYDGEYLFQELYQAAEEEARLNRVGLWGRCAVINAVTRDQ